MSSLKLLGVQVIELGAEAGVCLNQPTAMCQPVGKVEASKPTLSTLHWNCHRWWWLLISNLPFQRWDHRYYKGTLDIQLPPICVTRYEADKNDFKYEMSRAVTEVVEAIIEKNPMTNGFPIRFEDG